MRVDVGVLLLTLSCMALLSLYASKFVADISLWNAEAPDAKEPLFSASAPIFYRSGRHTDCSCHSSLIASASCGGVVLPLLITGCAGMAGSYTATYLMDRHIRVPLHAVSSLAMHACLPLQAAIEGAVSWTFAVSDVSVR